MLELLGDRFGIRRLLLEGGAAINGPFLAAGLVDELDVLIAPALDDGTEVQAIVARDPGLRGTIRLSLVSVQSLQHGVVHLRYAVLPA